MVWALVALSLIALVPATARADAYDVCFDEGKEQLGKARWAEACATFARCEGIRGATVKTRYQLGRCNEEQGKFQSAYEAFSDAARMSAQAGDDERAEVARKRAKELERKVARIRINVAPSAMEIDGLEVQRNGAVVPREVWNKTLSTCVARNPDLHLVAHCDRIKPSRSVRARFSAAMISWRSVSPRR
jgi:hypothetical protein